MRKRVFLASIFFSASLCVLAQTDEQQVFSTAGGEGSSASHQASWTIGEPIIQTVSAGGKTLTQGFQQNWAEIWSGVGNVEAGAVDITVYPNPTRHILYVAQSDELTGKQFVELSTANGKMVETKNMMDQTIELDMSPYESGNYFLRVMDADNTILRTFSIVVAK